MEIIVGYYFFTDFCAGWIRKLDPSNGNSVEGFASGTSSPVDLKVSTVRRDCRRLHDGGVLDLMYRARSAARKKRRHPQNQTVLVGQASAFSVSANGTPPFSYQWQRNRSNLTAASNTPSGNITPPLTGTLYAGGQTMDYARTGTVPLPGPNIRRLGHAMAHLSKTVGAFRPSMEGKTGTFRQGKSVALDDVPIPLL